MSEKRSKTSCARRQNSAAGSTLGGLLAEKPHLASGLVLAALIIAFLGPHLIRTETILYGWDVVHEKYYWRSWGFGQLRAGRLPLWNPYVLCGFPFIVDPIQGIFYPLNVLFLLLPVPLAFSWTVGLHLWIGSYFMYRFVARLTGNVWSGLGAAIVFGFSAFQAGRIYLGSIPQLCTMAWLPCLFYLAESFCREPRRGYAASIAFVVGLQCLSGHLQFSFYNLVALVLYAGFRLVYPVPARPTSRERVGQAARLSLSLVLGIGIACAVLVPLAYLQALSIRAGGGGRLFQQLGPFPPDQLIAFVAPDFFGNELSRPYWGDGLMAMNMVYVGGMALLLVAAALVPGVRGHRGVALFFAGLALLSLLLAMGRYVPGFIYLYKYVPGFRLFRFVSRWVSVTSFSLAVLAGLGLRVLFEAKGRNPAGGIDLHARGALRIAAAAVGLGAALALAYLFLPWGPIGRSNAWLELVRLGPNLAPKETMTPAFAARALETAKASLIRPIVLFPLCGGLLYVWVRTPRRRSLAAVATLCVMYLDLRSYSSQFIIPYPVRNLSWDPEIVSLLRSDQDPYRVETRMPVEALPLPGASIATYRYVNRYNQSYINRGMLYGIANVGGLFSLTDRRYMEFALGDPWYTFENHLLKDARTADMLNVRYLVAPPDAPPGDRDVEEVLRTPREVLYKNHRALPRAYIVHKAVSAESDEEARALLGDPSFDPRQAVVLIGQKGPRPVAECPREGERVAIIDYENQRMVVEAELFCPGVLVVSEAMYPGWRCEVDGKRAAIERANYVFRGVFLESGRHTITFSFMPKGLPAGIAVSAVSVSAAGLWWVSARRRRPTTGPRRAE